MRASFRKYSMSTGSVRMNRVKFIWPGYGENSRVLKWICERVSGKGKAVKTAIGYMPTVDAIDTEGLDISTSDLEEILTVSKDEWLKEIESIKDHYKGYGPKLPKDLQDQLAALEKRLND
jgi:phosphoenolpyruvate carboxykinase (GTP)